MFSARTHGTSVAHSRADVLSGRVGFAGAALQGTRGSPGSPCLPTLMPSQENQSLHEDDARQLREDKERAEAELMQVASQRDLLWKSHGTLQVAVERLEEQVQLHQQVITQLRQRNNELESEEPAPPRALKSAGLSSPEMSAVMQQLMQLLHSEPHRVINELCSFPVGAAVRLLQKDVLPLLPIDAAVCDRVQLQLLDVRTPADLGAFKQQLLEVIPKQGE
eukprot:TRINITY_DN7291_c0_g1_i5.p1 TRINITY_DN7291_c0_g1~~TRINITY_DN7291_c0_g1_i5.p1  ORF type:complete len:221 (+),score=70.45 TRINITY_DN7291_c0_g1_i5:437-1099(+)